MDHTRTSNAGSTLPSIDAATARRLMEEAPARRRAMDADVASSPVIDAIVQKYVPKARA